MRHKARALIVLSGFCLTILGAAVPATGQPGSVREPAPEGRRILAADGDLIVVSNDDRVRVVRRREGAVRVIADETRRFVVILADWTTGSGTVPDGQVDRSWRFGSVEGRWPFEPRWEGIVTIEEREGPSGGWPQGLVVESPQGTIWFTGPGPLERAQPPEVVAVLRYMSASSGMSRGSFDEIEQREVLMARDPERASTFISGAHSGTYAGGVTSSVELAQSGDAESAIARDAMRVGAGVSPPVKIRDVSPQVPEAALRAGVRGTVIIEIRIEPDGSVSAVRVLRSIPMLDEEAIRAARLWRFAPTRVNGQPVALVMTATVDFR